MSLELQEFDPAELPAPICEACGEPIEEMDPDCPARDEGVCAP